MKKLFLLIIALFAVNCTTTSSKTVSPKFAVGDCLKLNDDVIMAQPTEQRALLSLAEFKVIDVGQLFYVIEVNVMSQKMGRNTIEVEAVQKESHKVDCTPNENLENKKKEITL